MAFFHLFDDEWLSQEGEPSSVPPEQQTPDNSPSVQEDLRDGRDPDDILLVRCPHCFKVTWYDGGFTSWCEWCGKLAVSPDSEEDVFTLSDYWGYDPYWDQG